MAGEGSIDLLWVPGGLSHLDLLWLDSACSRFLSSLASFSRLIMYDHRGLGLSDPVDRPLTTDERMEEVYAVLNAVGSERTALLGYSEGGTTALMLAASDPQRFSHLIVYGSFITGFRDEEHPWGMPAAFFDEGLACADYWGEGRSLRLFAPSRDSPRARANFGRFERAAASPLLWRRIIESARELDVSDVLEAVHVPTLAIHAVDDLVPIENARELVRRVPDATLVELPGDGHIPWLVDWQRIGQEIERFLTGRVGQSSTDRALATILFTDIVASTASAARLGDLAWRGLLDRHDAIVKEQIELFGGRYVKSLGDGALAVFDGPARAVRCAATILETSSEQLGLTVRAGVHTGECELVGDDVAGIAVHIAARVAALAGPDEVLVTGTVKDLVAGSGLSFASRGLQTLAGIPEEWRVFALAAAEEAPPGAPAPALLAESSA